MKIEKSLCPYCGANLKIVPGQTNMECEYCGSTILISENGTVSPGTQSSDSSGTRVYYPRTDAYDQRTNVLTLPSDESDPGVSEDIEKDVPPVQAKKHSLLPPPGFRSKNILHMIIAVIGYLSILFTAASLGDFLDFIIFTLSGLSTVDIFTDWTGMFSGLKGLQSKNAVIQILSKLFWSIVIFTAWILILAMIHVALDL